MRSMVIIAAAFTISCSSPTGVRERATPIFVQVITDENHPVERAVVSLNGVQKGSTDGSGNLSLIVKAKDGDTALLEVSCPPDHSAVPKAREYLPIRHIFSTLGEDAAPEPLLVTFMCVPSTKRHVVIVKTSGGAGLRVNLMGKPIAYTDDDGIAHFTVEGSPDEEIELTIDTSSRPELIPRMPSRRLGLPARGRFLLFEQKFERVEKPKRRARRTRSKGPTRL